MTTRRSASRPTGAVAIAIVVVLVVIQMIVVAAVVAGARDQHLLVNRMDTMRAFYAAEGGMNMAMREVMKNADEDADGTIGTVSGDGNAANDPLLILARMSGTRSVASGITTLQSNGRSGGAHRRMEGKLVGQIGGSNQTLVVAFGRAGQAQPRYCAWNGSASGASVAMPSIGSTNIKWVRMKLCPARNETMFIAESDDDHVNIEFFNSSTWSSTNLVSSDTGGTNDRPEDFAYEQASNDGLSVYWKGTSVNFGYRTYNGSTFSSESLLSSPFTTECDWVTLAARPLCDEIMMLAVDGIAGEKLTSTYWNGSSFGAWTTVCNNLETNNEECFSMVFEAMSRQGLCVYIQSGQSTPRYRTWNGSSWSAEGSLPTVGAVGKWVRLAPDPSSDTVLCGVQDASNNLNLIVWNGSSWGSVLELETALNTTDRRQFDIAYERGTGKGMIVYGENGVNTPRYRVWNGSAWTAEGSLPSIGANTAIVHLARGFTNPELFAAISDTSRRLHVLRWSGTAWGAPTMVETSLSGPVKDQSFSLPEPTPQPYPRLSGWQEVAP